MNDMRKLMDVGSALFESSTLDNESEFSRWSREMMQEPDRPLPPPMDDSEDEDNEEWVDLTPHLDDLERVLDDAIAELEARGLKESSQDNVYQLEEIAAQIDELVDQAMSLLPKDSLVYDRAKSYWYPHMKQSIGIDRGGYMGSSMHSMMDSARQLSEKG